MEKIKSSFINKEQLPLLIQPQNAFSKNEFYQFLSQEKEQLKAQLLKYGGLLFRDFPLENADDFAQGIKQLGLGNFIDYIGGDSPRNKINEGVYTSTEAPPSIKIPLHNELSFVKNYPKHIYFFCEIAPKEKGETILADCRKVFKGINRPVMDRFNQKKLRYVSCYYYKSAIMDFINKIQPSHKSWMQVFETDSKGDVERKCNENEFEFKWSKNDWLQISQVRPATIKHPETLEDVWFNQAHLYDFNRKLLGNWRYVVAKLFYYQDHRKLHQIFFEDRSSVRREDLYHVMKVLDDETLSFPWKKGDFLVLDNVLAMHGRAPFEGKRRVLAAMTG